MQALFFQKGLQLPPYGQAVVYHQNAFAVSCRRSRWNDRNGPGRSCGLRLLPEAGGGLPVVQHPCQQCGQAGPVYWPSELGMARCDFLGGDIAGGVDPDNGFPLQPGLPVGPERRRAVQHVDHDHFGIFGLRLAKQLQDGVAPLRQQHNGMEQTALVFVETKHKQPEDVFLPGGGRRLRRWS